MKNGPRLRLWHWLNALIVTLLLATVYLRKWFFNGRKISGVIQEKLVSAQGHLNTEELKAAAGLIRDQMWDWHYRLGFVLTGLFLFRVMFSREKLPRPRGAFRKSTHDGIVKSLYAAFYLATLFMVVSGLMMYFSSSLRVPDDLTDEIKEIHELFQWFFLAFVGVHFAGVIRAELTDQPGVVSEMIHGDKKPESKD